MDREKGKSDRTETGEVKVRSGKRCGRSARFRSAGRQERNTTFAETKHHFSTTIIRTRQLLAHMNTRSHVGIVILDAFPRQAQQFGTTQAKEHEQDQHVVPLLLVLEPTEQIEGNRRAFVDQRDVASRSVMPTPRMNRRRPSSSVYDTCATDRGSPLRVVRETEPPVRSRMAGSVRTCTVPARSVR